MIANIYMRLLFLSIGLLLLASFVYQNTLDKLSLKMTAKTLHNGKYIATEGDVYYSVKEALLVTHFFKPIESITFSSSSDEFKIYNINDNSIILKRGADCSSENSFIYNFLNNKTQDMGLKLSGFKMVDSRIEDNLVISIWVPSANNSSEIREAELVQENYKPIFLGFYDDKKKPLQKIYYSNYQAINHIFLPLNITEFQYINQNDSLIIKRSYSDLKINENVDNTYLNFKIPNNARVIQ